MPLIGMLKIVSQAQLGLGSDPNNSTKIKALAFPY